MSVSVAVCLSVSVCVCVCVSVSFAGDFNNPESSPNLAPSMTTGWLRRRSLSFGSSRNGPNQLELSQLALEEKVRLSV